MDDGGMDGWIDEGWVDDGGMMDDEWMMEGG